MSRVFNVNNPGPNPINVGGDAMCDPGSTVTGGGYSLNNIPMPARPAVSVALNTNNGWAVKVDGINPGTNGNIQVVANCVRPGP